MKAYTDIEQSKKLAEILPLESADGFYEAQRNYHTGEWEMMLFAHTKWASPDVVIPAWSLAALLELIQDDIKIEKTLFDQSDLFTYSILSDTFDYRTYEHEELIDACVEMILKLKEKGLM